MQDFVSTIGTVLQGSITVIAAMVAVMTYRYTRRQTALALINTNTNLANLVNSTVIGSEPARRTFASLQEPIVGTPDDALLFMYVNYVHNAFRMYRHGAVSRQVWTDTLGSCAGMLGRLRREQVQRLLSRGYEKSFQKAVLARWDAVASAGPAALPPRPMLRVA